MSRIRLPLEALGSVTAPTALSVDLGLIGTKRMFYNAPLSMVDLPGIAGVMVADGITRQKHVVDDTLVYTGIVAPSTAPVATPSGSRGSVLLDLNANADGGTQPTNDDELVLNGATIRFVTALGPAAAGYAQVQIGSTLTETCDNYEALLSLDKTSEKWLDSTDGDVADLVTPTIDTTSFTGTDSRQVDAKDIGHALREAYLSSGTWDAAGGDCLFGTQGQTVGTSGWWDNQGGVGTGSFPAEGSYRYFYTFFRDIDSAESGRSPYHTVGKLSAGQVALSGLTHSADTDVGYVRWWRNLVSSEESYRGAEVASPTITDTDDLADSSLTAFEREEFDERLGRSYRAGPPVSVRHLAGWKGRVFGGGAILAASRSVGTADVTIDDATVTFTSLVSEDMVGRVFQVDGIAARYTIIEVDESLGTVELDRVYEAASDSTADYTIRDLRDPLTLYFSEPGLPNSWPTQNALTGVISDDPEGITGLVSYGGALIIFTRDSIWRLTGDDLENYLFTKVAGGVGCASGHTIVSVEGGLMWLGVDGVYSWDGVGVPQKLSSPSTTGDNVSGIDRTYERINLEHIALAHAHYNATERVVRLYVPLDGEVAPSHALVFDLGTRGTWGVDDAPGATGAGVVPLNDGSQATVIGDQHGNLWHADIGTSDGVYGVEGVQDVSSSTVRAITLSGTPLGSSDFSGAPVWIVRSDGTLTLRVVASNTSSVVTLTEDLDSALTAFDQIVLGGILWDIRSGRFDLGETYRRKGFVDWELRFAPKTLGEVSLSTAVDQEGFVLTKRSLDLTASAGKGRHRIQRWGVQHAFGLMAIHPGIEPEILSHELVFKLREGAD